MNKKLNYFQNRPKTQPIGVEAYLKRIGLNNEEPNLTFLRKIHKNHLLSIPFENLDIHYYQKIILKVDHIYNKIVAKNRGGICYELNLLLYHLLCHLGYDAYIGSARVYKGGQFTPEFDHMIVFVSLTDGLYLCDVGFGSLFTEPKKITPHLGQLDYTRYYRFERDPDDLWLLKESKDNSLYETVYKFEEKPREMIEFIPRCNYHQESLDSDIKQEKIVTKLFREGRVTLKSRSIKVNLFGETNTGEILNEDAFLSHLEQYFGISSSQLLHQRFD